VKIMEWLLGREENAIVSYRTLRRVVGVLGVALPVVLAVWGWLLLDGPHLERSISDYCALHTRDALVGILFTIGWFLFTQSGPAAPTALKLIRNRIYRTCGVILLGCIASIALAHRLLSPGQLAVWSPVFRLESLALRVFGISWFVKVDTLFRDAPA
jgi:hypothetical protein